MQPVCQKGRGIWLSKGSLWLLLPNGGCVMVCHNAGHRPSPLIVGVSYVGASHAVEGLRACVETPLIKKVLRSSTSSEEGKCEPFS
eukprot:scaffold15907_cov183-Amphora_coffeaeformis.AAC.4